MKSILVKSEMDSRALLYPLMRVLSQFNQSLIVSRNETLSRFIEGQFDGYYKNLRIIIDPQGNTDDLFNEYSVNTEDYDFVIYDNVGTLDFDYILVPISEYVTDWFYNEITYMDINKVTFILFGKATKSNIKEKIEQSLKEQAEQDEFEAEAAIHKSDSKSQLKDKTSKLIPMKFPSFEEVEKFESQHIMYNANQALIKLFYNIFKDTIGLTESQFISGVSRSK
jgi:hypothetical protein